MFKSTRKSLRAFSLCVSLFVASAVFSQTSALRFPTTSGDRCRYAAVVDFKKAYVSGILLLANADGIVSGSLFNEFGISVVSFTYHVARERLKIVEAISPLSRWYIRHRLRRDLLALMQALRDGCGRYVDEKYGLSFSLTALPPQSQDPNETSE